MGAFSEANHAICLRALLALDNVEFDLIAFFERFVSVQLDRRVVDEYVWPVFASDESVTLGVVKPLDFTFVLSHRLLPSWCFLRVEGVGKRGSPTPINAKTAKTRKRLIGD